MAIMDVAIRPATFADVEGIKRVLAAHDEAVLEAAVDVTGPYVRHLIGHAVSRVAEVGAEIVGFGAVLDTGVSQHLADLFIAPGLVGRGIGGLLLDAAFGSTQPRTTFASADPRALALYVRAGLTPWWVCLYLQGPSTGLPATPPSLGIQAAGWLALAELELAWTGAERGADHAFWAAQPGAESIVVSDSSGPVAIACARDGQRGTARALDRLVVRPGVDSLAPILAGIRHIGRGGEVSVTVPGPNPALPILLEAGFRIVDRDQFMASNPGLVDPIRLLPNPGML
jgi:GNAT superfamily N-acetyltransferase